MRNNGVVMNIVRGNQMSRISCLTPDARHCRDIGLLHRRRHGMQTNIQSAVWQRGLDQSFVWIRFA
jgi:hypothetical protein